MLLKMTSLPNNSDEKTQKCKFGECTIFLTSNDVNYNTTIANETEVQNIANIIYYHTYKRRTYVLVQKRSKLMTHPGEICSPGGRCDPGETWVQSISRESLEECGFDISKHKGILWCASNNLHKQVNIHVVTFAMEIPFRYPFKKPSHSNELDKTFYDSSQTGMKNYHRWEYVNDLLDGKCGPLLQRFRAFLLNFIRIKRNMEEEISMKEVKSFSFRAKEKEFENTKDSDEKTNTVSVVNNKISLSD
jgi:8-oxo-dGTP pyrophosphatase MutT (NUDIX family)